MADSGGKPVLAQSGSPGSRRPGSIMKPAPKKKAGVGRTLAIVFSVILVLVLGIAAAVGWFGWRLASTFDNQTETIVNAFPDEDERPAARDDNAQTILLLGSDTRGRLDQSTLDGPQDGRSDTIMVARIPADREAIYVMSIMRDSWVDIPGYGNNKINAAMAFGGVPLTVKTVEALIGSRIDHVAAIDFEGFKGLTDALGGVTVNNTVQFSAGGYTFEQGEITLSGSEALTFVRERKSFTDGDYQRVRNQQTYVKGLLKELISRDTLTSPAKLMGAVEEISPYLQVSEDLDSGYLIGLLPGMRGIRPSDITFFTAPTAGVGWSPDGTQSIIELDWPKMETLKKAFEDDTVGQWVATNG